MEDVLSALKGMGVSETSHEVEKEEEEEPDFGPVPTAKERAQTMPVLPPPVAAKPDLMLRVRTNPSADPNWRKSGVPPSPPSSLPPFPLSSLPPPCFVSCSSDA